ncbi:MAG: class I SAM-dependent methyltransferase [bacterium]
MTAPTAPAAPTAPTAPARPLDMDELQAFVGKFVGDLSVTHHAVTVVLGDRLGLYRALDRVGPATAAQVADEAGCDERYVQEWLNAQVAADYCGYDAGSGLYQLSPAQAACLADDSAPTYLAAGMYLAGSLFKSEEQLGQAYRTGAGFGWGDHHHDLFHGVERFFRPGYAANLVSAWIPALDGVHEKLEAGISVADVGCGHGSSTIILAAAYPNSTVVGFDPHAPSIAAARKAAAEAGLGDRVRFEVASAQDFDGRGYGLVTVFDALHDMGDPVGAARHIREALAPDGTWLLVEPMAGESLDDNRNPIGRLFYSASSMICTPNARSQSGGYALGAQASQESLQAVVEEAGFTRFRRATETPVNRVLEIRP